MSPMKRSGSHSGSGERDSKRAKPCSSSSSVLYSLLAQLASTKDGDRAAQGADVQRVAHAAAVEALTPLQVLDVSGQSNFEGRATMTWTVKYGAVAPTHFVIGAIDATTGARHENIAREDGGDAIGSIVVNAAQLTAGRKLRFFVTAVFTHDDISFCSAPSEPTKPITVDAKDFGAVALNALPLWNSDCAALAKLIATPRGATHGAWSSAQHPGALRSHYVRGFGLARVPRLGKAIKARSPTLLASIREVANTATVMRAVLRFALPQYCTPTREERRDICMVCHVSDGVDGLANWLRRGVDPNTVDLDGDASSTDLTRIRRTGGAFRHRRDVNKTASLLIIAARQGHVGLVDMLLQSGADILKTKTNGASCLFVSAEEGHLETVDRLLAAGAEVDKAKITTGSTPLYVAAQNGHTLVVQTLIAAGGDVNQTNLKKGSTPLLIAAQQGHLAVVERLIAGGADIEKALATDGRTPLFMAAQKGHTAVVEKIIAAGAEVNKATTTNGGTPLYIAAQSGHAGVVHKLIAGAVDVNQAETDHNMTPLYKAAEKGHTGIVATLLQHGADKTIRGWQDRTPLDVAKLFNHTSIVALLRCTDSDLLEKYGCGNWKHVI